MLDSMLNWKASETVNVVEQFPWGNLCLNLLLTVFKCFMWCCWLPLLILNNLWNLMRNFWKYPVSVFDSYSLQKHSSKTASCPHLRAWKLKHREVWLSLGGPEERWNLSLGLCLDLTKITYVVQHPETASKAYWLGNTKITWHSCPWGMLRRLLLQERHMSLAMCLPCRPPMGHLPRLSDVLVRCWVYLEMGLCMDGCTAPAVPEPGLQGYWFVLPANPAWKTTLELC